MARFTVVTLLLLGISMPAFGKAHNDTYPVACSVLWDAVKDTLSKPGDYSMMASDDTEMTASYIVVGAQRQRVDTIALNPKDNGCKMQVQAPDSGYMNDDEGLFRKRVSHSLAKLQAAKPAEPAKPNGGK